MRVRLHCHSVPKTGIATGRGRTAASATPPTVKRSAMTMNILDLRQMNSITMTPGSMCKACTCVRIFIAPSCSGFTIRQFGGINS